MATNINRPDYVKLEYLEFLDDLRESGNTNMFGASPYLENEFTDLSTKQARAIVIYWMKTFGKER